MKTNTSNKLSPIQTHEGAPAKHINPEMQLRRSVMACMLWEDSFYESGESIADRIKNLVPLVPAETVARIAIEARSNQHLRHIPLLLVRIMAALPTHKHIVAKTLEEVIQRPDELTEFLSIYWKDGRCSISSQVKKGLAKAFQKFSEYSFAKYDQSGKRIKLRDVLFLCHAKPKEFFNAYKDLLHGRTYIDKKTGKKTLKNIRRHEDTIFSKIVNGTLQTPDTWEVALSSGTDKLTAWNRLLEEEKLGGLAFVRNLRNMKEAGVSETLIALYASVVNLDRVLPFRYISAARAVPQWEPLIEQMMFKSLKSREVLKGRTVIVVDNSGSMYFTPVSKNSDIDRSDAACALAILVREVCQHSLIVSFSDSPSIVPARRGFALRDAIKTAVRVGGTYTDSALALAEGQGYDRIIVITDEQSHQRIREPIKGSKAYFLNVAVEKNGIGYGRWTHIDGFSESCLDFIQEAEREGTLDQ